jgi:hypothetical protein
VAPPPGPPFSSPFSRGAQALFGSMRTMMAMSNAEDKCWRRQQLGNPCVRSSRAAGRGTDEGSAKMITNCRCC